MVLNSNESGFERHIHQDHCMWEYVGLMVHVLEKDPTDYNGWEQHIAHKMEQHDTSFLPRNQAIVLQEFQSQEEEAIKGLEARMTDMVVQNEQLVKSVGQLHELHTHLSQTVEGMAMQSRQQDNGANAVRAFRGSRAGARGSIVGVPTRRTSTVRSGPSTYAV